MRGDEVNYGVSGLHQRFGEIRALSGVDLDVPAGSVVAVVGGDGAGKTTLLRCLVGRYAPAAGHVRRPPSHQIGYMPSTSGTWRGLTVDENIEFVSKVFKMSRPDRERRRADLIERAGLAEAADRSAADLSGGMRQKLGFVLAMLHEPELLVLDEPSTGVDPVSRVELWRLIAEAAATGTAVALTTTYLDEAERASVVTVLDRGRAIASGTSDDVMNSMPGYITAPDRPSVPARSWRRGRSIREWHPATDRSSAATSDGSRLSPSDLDFEDVVIARLLEARGVDGQAGAT
jgi:ABC-2 type transport system ATP-binding protein